MIHLANILVVTDDAALGQQLLSMVRRHGYDGRLVSSQEAALATAQQEHPDVILIGPTLDGGTAISLGKALKALADCRDIPVCLYTPDLSGEIRRDAYAALIDDVMAAPPTDQKLLARLRPLVRLSTMYAELYQRSNIARRFGVDVPDNLPRVEIQGHYKLLIAGDDGDDMRAPLADAADITHVTDPFQAEDTLGSTMYDIALLAPQDEAAPYLDLCAQIRNNPRLFNMPVLILAKPDQVGEDTAYHHGASARYERPVNPLALQATALSLVRRQRQRWEIRQALQRTLQSATRDSSTGVYNRAFMDSYLIDRVEFAKAHGRHLSVMFFRIPDVEGIRQRFGTDQADHLRLQLAQWISSLLRGEDLVARYEENEFCVILPDTPKGEAEVVMHRIAGVLTYTDFAVKDVYQPVKVWVRVGGADLHPDDDIASLLMRARHNIV